MEDRFDVVVVGGGQAGLVAGYLLRDTGLTYRILDHSARVGQSWRSRWDSLELFTVARYSALPGLAFPGHPEHFPTKDEVADYLEDYARRFDLPVQLRTRVHSVSRTGASYAIHTSAGSYEANQVVVATGAFQVPYVPPFGRRLDDGVVQLHAADYHNPEQLPEGRDVLVVGAGNSGVAIAEELARSRRVRLAVGTKLGRLPRRILGKSVHWWGERLHMIQAPVHTWYGRRAAESEGLIGTSVRQLVRRHGVEAMGRIVDARGRTAVFDDRTTLDVDVVVWATGYVQDFGWLKLPVLDARGSPVHRRGVTALPGLYFLGLQFLYSPGSSLIGWVHHDARFVVDRIVERAARSGAGLEGVGVVDRRA